MKPTKTTLAIATPILAASFLAACGDSKISGTDEQANSLTAKIIAEWLETDTLTASPSVSDSSSSYFIGHNDLPAGIKTEFGELVRVYHSNFESIYCQTKNTWFVYSVNVADTAVTKNFTIPDSVSPEAFKNDCTLDGGTLVEEEPLYEQLRFTCTLPSPMDAEIAPGNMQYFDINWKKYAKQIVDICGEPLPLDSLDIKPQESDPEPISREDALIETYLQGNTLSKWFMVDFWCADKGLSLECGNSDIHLDNGILYYSLVNISESIRCQGLVSDSLGELPKIRSYSVFLDSNIATRTWRNDNFSRMSESELAEALIDFKNDCEGIEGKLSDVEDNTITCKIEVAPDNKEDFEKGDTPLYIFTDPSWRKFATKVVDACKNYGE